MCVVAEPEVFEAGICARASWAGRNEAARSSRNRTGINVREEKLSRMSW